MSYTGIELNLTDLSAYSWCPNYAILNILDRVNKGKYITLNEKIEMSMHHEYYPSILISKKGQLGIPSYYDVFYLNDSDYDNFFGGHNYSFELYEEVFSKYKDELFYCLGYKEYRRLVQQIGKLVEYRHSKANKEGIKTKLSTYYNGFIVNAIPDEILENTIYEFKTEIDSSLVKKQLGIAEFQADVTAYLFGYDYIDVEVIDLNNLEIYKNKRKAELEMIEKTLEETFYMVEKGKIYDYDKDIVCKGCKHAKSCFG